MADWLDSACTTSYKTIQYEAALCAQRSIIV